MYRILLPVDTNEERAVQAARAIVDLPGDASEKEVVVLNVFEEFNINDDFGGGRSEDLFEHKDVPDSVGKATEVFEAEGIASEVRFEHGDPTKVILALADETDADALVISGRKRSPAGKVLFGSVTQSVLLSAEIPVIAVMAD